MAPAVAPIERDLLGAGADVPGRAGTARGRWAGLAMFAVGMAVWSLAQLLFEWSAVAFWALALLGGWAAVQGLGMVYDIRRGSRVVSTPVWVPLTIAVTLSLVGLSAMLTGAARTLMVSAGVVVLVAAFARAMADLRSVEQRLSEQVVLEERRRVAGEVHDVVGHALAVTMLHITAARLSLPDDPDAAVEALDEAERHGRESMAQIRGVVRLLRSDEDIALLASPDASEVPALLEGFRRSGVEVTAQGFADTARLSPLASTTLYRLVQEGVTNAVKHAQGPVEVHLDVQPEAVVLEILNAWEEDRVPVADGAGLSSARARVAVVGGTFQAGPDSSGRSWRLAATLPA
ncbi:MAG: histidine kinase [Jiangellales bacterium]